jgi:HSP20 family protein
MITLLKDPFFEAIDRVFDTQRYNNIPQTNISKTETEYTINLSVPGLIKDDLKIYTKEGTLKISFEKQEEPKLFVSSFVKSYIIPDDVKEKDIEGKVENGILTISLPIDKKKTLERLISLN